MPVLLQQHVQVQLVNVYKYSSGFHWKLWIDLEERGRFDAEEVFKLWIKAEQDATNTQVLRQRGGVIVVDDCYQVQY